MTVGFGSSYSFPELHADFIFVNCYFFRLMIVQDMEKQFKEWLYYQRICFLECRGPSLMQVLEHNALNT